MDLATRKYNFIQELITIDERILDELERTLKANKKDWFTELSADEQQEIAPLPHESFRVVREVKA